MNISVRLYTYVTVTEVYQLCEQKHLGCKKEQQLFDYTFRSYTCDQKL